MNATRVHVPEQFVRDVIRTVDKALDVLRQVDERMEAEARMHGGKHMADVVRPNPLAAAVSTAIAELEMSKRRYELQVTPTRDLAGDGQWGRTSDGPG